MTYRYETEISNACFWGWEGFIICHCVRSIAIEARERYGLLENELN